MKHNLENRPKIEDVWKSELSGTEDGYNSEAASIAGKMEEWFEGFQKELQKRIQHWESLIQPNDCYHKIYCVNFAKEILGE